MKFKITLFIALFFSFTLVFAQKNTTKLVSSNEKETIIEFKINSFDFKDVKTPKGIEKVIVAGNATAILEKGFPDMPKFTESIIIPDFGKTKIEIISSNYYEIKDVNIAPSKGNFTRDINPETVSYEYGKIYKIDNFFPTQIAGADNPYIARDYRGQAIHVYPFTYNAVKKVLRVYTDITVKITALKEKGINEFVRNNSFNKIDREFKNIYSSHFINYNSSKYTPVEEDGNMLIICYDDWTNEMQALVDWKNKIGRACEMVTVTDAGGTASAIKTYVENYYNTNGLTYLLLVGDASQVPTNSGVGLGGDSDNAYAYISGDDHYLEFFVGRFSAETPANVSTQVQRTITYENGSTLENGWLNKTMGVASALGDGQGDDGEADFVHVRNMQSDLTGFTYVTPTVEQFDGSQGGNDATGDPTGATVGAELNTGVGNALYCGHGGDFSWVSSGFDISDINNLTNDNKLPFIFDVACVNGNFVGQTCFGEAWLRAENAGQPTGAIAIVASTINQDWAQPMVAQDEMVDLIVGASANGTKRTFSGIAVNGMFLMNEETSDFNMTDTWTTFGDPSLLIRTDNTSDMAISHSSTIIIGTSEFAVNCDLDGALACLSFEGNIIGTATVSGGIANVPVSGLTAGQVVDIAVTGFNKVTYLSTATVIAPTGPYVVLDNFDINGTNSIDFGGSDAINITLKNVGADDASNITATLTTTDASVTSISNNVDISFGDIVADATASVSGQFNITVANNIVDQYVIPFTLSVTDGTENWESNFNVKVNAPALSISDLVILNDDNSDGTLDPGETGNIVFSVTNTGHADANFDGTLSEVADANDYLTLNVTNVAGVSIVVGTSADFSYSASADAATPLGFPVSVKLDVVDVGTGNYTASSTQEFNIGIIPIYPISGGGTLTVCTGTFYDSGLETGEYQINEDYIMTFLPPADQDFVVVNFTSFETESGYDYLYVYDGSDVSSPLIGTFDGTDSPGMLMGANGLTFKFHSDGIVTKAGWVAEVSCYTATEAPACVSNPVPADNSTNVFPLKLSWDTSAGATSYDVYFGTNSDPYSNTAVNVTSTEYNISATANTDYYWAVLPKNDIGTASGCDVYTFQTGEAQYLMANATVTTCNGMFYDTGGADGQYSSNEDFTMTFMPGEVGKMISVVFVDGTIIEGTSSNQYDKLYAYDGIDASATQFAGSPFSNSDGLNIGTLVATNSDGAITFQFTSDGTVTKDGWEAVVSCVNSSEIVSVNTKGVDIYPNPTSGLFNIVTENNDSKIEIYSVNGQLVYSEQANSIQTQIDISSLVKGIYFIKISSENSVVNSKIILQ